MTASHDPAMSSDHARNRWSRIAPWVCFAVPFTFTLAIFVAGLILEKRCPFYLTGFIKRDGTPLYPIPMWPIDLINGLAFAQIICMFFLICLARGWRWKASAIMALHTLALWVAHSIAFINITGVYL